MIMKKARKYSDAGLSCYMGICEYLGQKLIHTCTTRFCVTSHQCYRCGGNVRHWQQLRSLYDVATFEVRQWLRFHSTGIKF